MTSSRFAAEIERLRARLHGMPGARQVGVLREHLESFPVAALAADHSSRYIAANARAEELTGYSANELTKLVVLDLTSVANSTDSEQLWSEFISTGEQQGHYEVRRKDGSFVPVHYWAFANVASGIHLSLMVPEVTVQA
jgi:PAS domain S-box-containing protein